MENGKPWFLRTLVFSNLDVSVLVWVELSTLSMLAVLAVLVAVPTTEQ